MEAALLSRQGKEAEAAGHASRRCLRLAHHKAGHGGGDKAEARVGVEVVRGAAFLGLIGAPTCLRKFCFLTLRKFCRSEKCRVLRRMWRR